MAVLTGSAVRVVSKPTVIHLMTSQRGETRRVAVKIGDGFGAPTEDTLVQEDYFQVFSITSSS